MKETTLDSMGRIVIPKAVRVRLGLAAGTALEIEDTDDAIVLRPVREEAPLRREGGVLIFAGRALSSLEGAVERSRSERLAHVGGLQA